MIGFGVWELVILASVIAAVVVAVTVALVLVIGLARK